MPARGLMSLPHASRASIKARLKNATDFGMCAFLGDRTASMKSPAPLSLRQSITRVVICFPSVLCPTATRRGAARDQLALLTAAHFDLRFPRIRHTVLLLRACPVRHGEWC